MTDEFRTKSWGTAKVEAKQILYGRAKARLNQTIAYSELAAQISAIRFEPDSRDFYGLLDEISREEHAAGRGLLSVLVVHKTGDKMPGPGFFTLAKELKSYTGSKEDFWIQELKRVLAAHASA